MMNKTTAKILISLLIIFVFFDVLLLAQAVLMPKYRDDIKEGGLTADYYNEKIHHDVIFVGDCEVYENISPITLWEDYGISSYIRGSAQQLIWQSYYLMEETFEYEQPDVVVFNVLSMKYGEPQNEAYNRMTLDGMPLSLTKLHAIEASMTEDESLISYIFPILRYHDRWSTLTADDFRYAFKHETVSHSGYLMRVDTKPMTQLPTPVALSDYTLPEVCFEYLDEMRYLCAVNGAELLLIKSPSLYPHWYDEWDEQIANYAERTGLTYINYIDLMDECGIDMQTDTYDGGLHLNMSGAEKLAEKIGETLSEKYNVPDRSNNESYSAVWDEKCRVYYECAEAQYEEIEEYGYLKSAAHEGE